MVSFSGDLDKTKENSDVFHFVIKTTLSDIFSVKEERALYKIGKMALKRDKHNNR